MLKARHAAERLQGAWHGGLSSIDQLRGRMQDCLAEFVVSRDEAEVPPWHLFVWQLGVSACDHAVRCMHVCPHEALCQSGELGTGALAWCWQHHAVLGPMCSFAAWRPVLGGICTAVKTGGCTCRRRAALQSWACPQTLDA